MSVTDIRMAEHDSRGVPLKQLGYIELAGRALGSRASDKDVEQRAFDRFQRRNRERLSFLDVSVRDRSLHTQGTAGVVPLLPALDSQAAHNLVVSPMSPWHVLSEFVGATHESDWLRVNTEWPISRSDLDLELWHFAKPFLSEAKSVLSKPGRAFVTVSRLDPHPAGGTDWQDYAVNRRPYGDASFRNRVPEPSMDAPPHRLMRWCVGAVAASIREPSVVPRNLLEDIDGLENLLGGIPPAEPDGASLRGLPRGGAWSGYSKVYAEIERLAALSGLTSGRAEVSCAFALSSEVLFERMVREFASEWGARNGFTARTDLDDSSRVSITAAAETRCRMLRSLRPDVVLVSKDAAVIIDAKYKKHFDLARIDRARDPGAWYEDFRHDIHQVLCYGVGHKKPTTLFALSHPSAQGPGLSTRLDFWRIGGPARQWLALLPVRFGGGASSLAEVKRSYFDSLDDLVSETALTAG